MGRTGAELSAARIGAELSAARIEAYLHYLRGRDYDKERLDIARVDLVSFCDMLGDADVTTLSKLEIEGRCRAVAGFATPPAVVNRMRETMIVFRDFCRSPLCDAQIDAALGAEAQRRAAQREKLRRERAGRGFDPAAELGDAGPQPRVLRDFGAITRDALRPRLVLLAIVAGAWLLLASLGSIFWLVGWLAYLGAQTGLVSEAVRIGKSDPERQLLADRDLRPFWVVAIAFAPGFFVAHAVNQSDVEGFWISSLIAGSVLAVVPVGVLVAHHGAGAINGLYPPAWVHLGRRLPGDTAALLIVGFVYGLVSVLSWVLTRGLDEDSDAGMMMRVFGGMAAAWVLAYAGVMVGRVLRGHAALFRTGPAEVSAEASTE